MKGFKRREENILTTWRSLPLITLTTMNVLNAKSLTLEDIGNAEQLQEQKKKRKEKHQTKNQAMTVLMKKKKKLSSNTNQNSLSALNVLQTYSKEQTLAINIAKNIKTPSLTTNVVFVAVWLFSSALELHISAILVMAKHGK